MSCSDEKEKGWPQRASAVVCFLFACLDSCTANGKHSSFRAAVCGVELALFDLWGKALKRPVRELLGSQGQLIVIQHAHVILVDDPQTRACPLDGRGARFTRLRWCVCCLLLV